MSAPPSQNPSPADDFVIWPEASAPPGAVLADEAAIKGALVGLAPADWVKGEKLASAGQALEAPVKEERFYPASRAWFRTTAALEAGEGAEKWWQPTAVPPVARPDASSLAADGGAAAAEPVPAAPSMPPLSSEEILGLAASELTAITRLKAHPVSEAGAVTEQGPGAVSGPAQPLGGLFREAARAEVLPAPPAIRPLDLAVPAPAETSPFVQAGGGGIVAGRGQPGGASAGGLVAGEFGRAAAPGAEVAAGVGLPELPVVSAGGREASDRVVVTGPTAAVAAVPAQAAVARAAEGDGELMAEDGRRPRRVRRRRDEREGEETGGWGQRVAVLFGLLSILAATAAMMTRDQLPDGRWVEAGRPWWEQVRGLFLPRAVAVAPGGVAPRVSEGGPPEAVAAGTGGRTAEAGLETVRPALFELPAAAPSPAPTQAAPQVDQAAAGAGGAGSPPAAPAASAVPPALEDTVSAMDAEPGGAGETPAGRVLSQGGDAGSAEVLAPRESGTAPEAVPDERGGAGGDVQTAGGGEGSGPLVPPVEPPVRTPDLIEGEKAVRSLIAAGTVEEVLPWIFNVKELAPVVQKYHAEHPLFPLVDSLIEHEYSGVIPDTGQRAHVFNILHPSHPRGFPISVEETPQGYRIDWQSYIQWRDGWLQRFLEKKGTAPETLFVTLRRTHYFNDDVPRLDEKFAFKLTSAVPGDEGAVAFVEKNSSLGLSLAGQYEWRTLYFPVVELQWVPVDQESPEGRYLRINRIVRPTWRRLGP